MVAMDGFDDRALLASARLLGERLLARGERVATAESCTGGWVGKALTDVAGSSAWFGFGIVSYANDAKERVLGVPAETLREHGAVSRPVVEAMVRGVLELSGADCAVAISGVAGPEASENKPAGMVWFAWARRAAETVQGREMPTPDAQASHRVAPRRVVVDAECCQFAGDRDAVRRASVGHALAGLLARLPA